LGVAFQKTAAYLKNAENNRYESVVTGVTFPNVQ
jgi:hypothetical protein